MTPTDATPDDLSEQIRRARAEIRRQDAAARDLVGRTTHGIVSRALAAVEAHLAAPLRPQTEQVCLRPPAREYLLHVADGLTDPEIALRMNTSESMLYKHVTAIRRELGVRERPAMVAIGIRRGIIPYCPAAPDTAWPQLTRRDVAVIRLVAAGYSNARIARSLGISLSAVAHGLRQAAARLGARNRPHLVLRSVEAGVLALALDHPSSRNTRPGDVPATPADVRHNPLTDEPSGVIPTPRGHQAALDYRATRRQQHPKAATDA